MHVLTPFRLLSHWDSEGVDGKATLVLAAPYRRFSSAFSAAKRGAYNTH